MATDKELEDLKRALGDRDEQLEELERALGMAPREKTQNRGKLIEVHRNFVGKCCGPVLRGYYTRQDPQNLYLADEKGTVYPVSIASITKIADCNDPGLICANPG